MPIVTFRYEDLIEQAAPAAPVAVPIDAPISQVRSRSIISETSASSRSGAWECSPGQWRRQILQAEFCHFLEGEAIFTPDEGEPVRLSAGDSAYFPKGSSGTWNIIEHSRKVFVIFDESDPA